MKSKPADKIQDLQFFGEFGGVNPSVSDSSTYTFLSAKSMSETFEGNTDGCYLYSRNSSPSNLYLEEALAAMEETESANVFSSGMAAITSSILQICKSNDHIISSRTVYGGTYAFLKNLDIYLLLKFFLYKKYCYYFSNLKIFFHHPFVLFQIALNQKT